MRLTAVFTVRAKRNLPVSRRGADYNARCRNQCQHPLRGRQACAFGSRQNQRNAAWSNAMRLRAMPVGALRSAAPGRPSDRSAVRTLDNSPTAPITALAHGLLPTASDIQHQNVLSGFKLSRDLVRDSFELMESLAIEQTDRPGARAHGGTAKVVLRIGRALFQPAAAGCGLARAFLGRCSKELAPLVGGCLRQRFCRHQRCAIRHVLLPAVFPDRAFWHGIAPKISPDPDGLAMIRGGEAIVFANDDNPRHRCDCHTSGLRGSHRDRFCHRFRSDRAHDCTAQGRRCSQRCSPV